MKNSVWYELFETLPNNSGTQTIRICKTLAEARRFKKLCIYGSKELHIDKWRDTSNPTMILAVE